MVQDKRENYKDDKLDFPTPEHKRVFWVAGVRRLFAWIFATIGLLMLVLGVRGAIDLGLKAVVFTKADDQCIYLVRPVAPPVPERKGSEEMLQPTPEEELKRCKESQISQRQREAVNAIASIVVGLPLFLWFYLEARRS